VVHQNLMPLKKPGAVLLISCYELGHQPYSIASPGGLLHEAGYEPAALDLAVERLRPEIVTAARVVAIAVPMHTALRIGSNVVARVRSMNPDCHICLYGLYASLNAGALLARGADSIIGGEFEEPLLRLIQDLDRGGPGAVPGVRTRRFEQPSWLRKIRFAVPRRHLLPPLHRYAHLEVKDRRLTTGYVEASRGCRHLCRHCPIPAVYGGRFFIVPRDVVLADVRNQVASGALHITFGDPDFLNGPGHVMAIVRRVHGEFPDLTFDFTAKIEHLIKYRDLLPELARLGCLFITSAVESLSDRVLSILDKGHTRADFVRALELIRAAGIALRPSFVPFTPWTSLEDYGELLRFIEEENLVDHLDAVQLSIRLLLPPGSLLLDRAELRPHLGPLDSDRFTYLWTHPDATMDRLQKKVGAIVEGAARDGEDCWRTFLRIRQATELANGTPASARPEALLHPPALRDKGRPPRLSEPWYC
jgi:radical SAM superfamily enzyme YgiQ (UPF0313 family)